MSELRQDLVSGDWVIMAPERAKRPHQMLGKRKARKSAPKSTCPFERPEETGNWPPIIAVPGQKNWRIIVIPNKFPALAHGLACSMPFTKGPYSFRSGVGHHDLVITRDHNKNAGALTLAEGIALFQVIQRRFRIAKADKCLVYTSAFFNWGSSAGASIYHPHYQLLSLPIIPPEVTESLVGSAAYFKKHRRCVHCEILRYERSEKKRIIEENARAISITPFVPRSPFEISIYPKRHQHAFEVASPADLRDVVRMVQSVIRRVKRHLNDPDFNFFIHTAPLKNQGRYHHYHWHIDVVPKISISAGFELSTGVDINVVDPDRAAAILRGRAVT